MSDESNKPDGKRSARGKLILVLFVICVVYPLSAFPMAWIVHQIDASDPGWLTRIARAAYYPAFTLAHSDVLPLLILGSIGGVIALVFVTAIRLWWRDRSR